jgi:hypothetical protein
VRRGLRFSEAAGGGGLLEADLGPRGTSSVTGVVLSVVGRATEELGQGGLGLRMLLKGERGYWSLGGMD